MKVTQSEKYKIMHVTNFIALLLVQLIICGGPNTVRLSQPDLCNSVLNTMHCNIKKAHTCAKDQIYKTLIRFQLELHSS